MGLDSALEIVAYGAWNGGTIVDNSIYEEKGLSFKGGIPVTNQTIEERMGVRTRKVAGTDERIGVTALQDLLVSSDIDPSRIKLVVGATNVGDDKHDPGPLIRFPYDILREHCPNAHVVDLYAGCPGFNVAIELSFMLSLTGFLNTGDITVIVGAENIHRAQSFQPDNTANIIFGDDAMATALKTGVSQSPDGQYFNDQKRDFEATKDPITAIAKAIYALNGTEKFDGIMVDNQLGNLIYRVPATAARVQHALVKLMYPDEAQNGVFNRFRESLEFYDRRIRAFAFDIMTLDPKPEKVEALAKAYVQSGKYNNIISVFLAPDASGTVTLHRGAGFTFKPPPTGIIDTLTSTHGCYADYIQAVSVGDDVFGDMDGKGVFLYATRGARSHLHQLLSANSITMDQVDLLIEHQANFAMIPLTLEQVLDFPKDEIKQAVSDMVANKLITNVHERGNCSVVCMQRLPYDLKRGALREDRLQGLKINANLDQLKKARLILNDSVGAGMTRSSFLQRL
jgi:3-oxoacyl-[acyl-carrier-protein] synthase III